MHIRDFTHRTEQNQMTLIQTDCDTKTYTMDPSINIESIGKTSRPVRNRRYTRRSLVSGQRPQKRLFTPEIKRYLKDWLVRRRDNPYPNREEKKYLSRETGLTYIQICNWFANWRRKLKNVTEDRHQLTWGHLIRTYNDRAQGNVEHFSICSEDSIWSEPELSCPTQDTLELDAEYDSLEPNIDYQHDGDIVTLKENCDTYNNNSYIIETKSEARVESKNTTSPMVLSKWLESAARFQPSESNYAWWSDGRRRTTDIKLKRIALKTMISHDRDEVEAAVALTTLATSSSRITAQ